ncbi:(2Fe-2S)-binding protein [Paenibacillus allorhizosphaerae]
MKLSRRSTCCLHYQRPPWNML